MYRTNQVGILSTLLFSYRNIAIEIVAVHSIPQMLYYIYMLC